MSWVDERRQHDGLSFFGAVLCCLRGCERQGMEDGRRKEGNVAHIQSFLPRTQNGMCCFAFPTELVQFPILGRCEPCLVT